MTIAMRCGRLIDGVAPEPVEDVVVFVDDGRIQEIAPGGAAVPAAARVIDLRGATVLPGLIDAHDHLCFDWNDPKDMLAREPDTWSVLRGAGTARRALRAGITTLRVMGEKNLIDLQLQRAIRAGLVDGPDLIVSGQALTITGGVQSWFPGNEVNTIPEIRQQVRRQAAAGVDLIKIFATGSAASRSVHPLAAAFDRDEIFAAVNEAKRLGLPLAAHCHGGDSARDLVDAGAHSIEHGTWLTEDVLRDMQRQGTFLVYTIGYAYMVADYPGATPFQRERCHAMIEAYHQTAALARRIGVRIGIGTDENHADLVIEMRNLIEAGYSHMEAIQAGTRWNADVCRVADVTGSIEPGKRADIIAVAGDPLRDIDAMTQVQFVMKQGTVYHHGHDAEREA